MAFLNGPAGLECRFPPLLFPLFLLMLCSKCDTRAPSFQTRIGSTRGPNGSLETHVSLCFQDSALQQVHHKQPQGVRHQWRQEETTKKLKRHQEPHTERRKARTTPLSRVRILMTYLVVWYRWKGFLVVLESSFGSGRGLIELFCHARSKKHKREMQRSLSVCKAYKGIYIYIYIYIYNILYVFTFIIYLTPCHTRCQASKSVCCKSICPLCQKY